MVFTTFIFLVTVFWAAPAAAYPWIMKSGHTNCSQCHNDPMGGGLLTNYGRAQGEILLRMPWGERDEEWEPGRAAEFAFGVVPLPERVQVGGTLRPAFVRQQTGDADPNARPILMQTDLRAQVRIIKGLRAYGSLAFSTQVESAWLNRGDPDQDNQMHLLSREHWVGYDITDTILVRAGRIALPFGVRSIHHTAFVRDLTRTSINDHQQHGLAASYNGGFGRGELMLIAGNLQVAPAEYREGGYSLFFEKPFGPLYLGISSMAASAERDVETFLKRSRSANGLSLRSGITEKLSLLAEVNLLADAHGDADAVLGSAGYLELNYELIQGIHLKTLGEWGDPGSLPTEPYIKPNYGVWLSAVWFVLPHTDLRLDIMEHWFLDAEGKTTRRDGLLLHLHFYL